MGQPSLGNVPLVGPILSPPTVKAPAVPPEGPPEPTQVSPTVLGARRQRRAASSFGQTTLTSPQGLTGLASTTKKTLLGQ